MATKTISKASVLERRIGNERKAFQGELIISSLIALKMYKQT